MYHKHPYKREQEGQSQRGVMTMEAGPRVIHLEDGGRSHSQEKRGRSSLQAVRGKETDFPVAPPGGTQPWPHLDCSP